MVSATAVPLHVPVAIVPNVVMFVEPAKVEIAVFSTLFNDKSVFTSVALLPSKPLAVNFA